MPVNWTKHAQEVDVVIDSVEFAGGTNISASPESLQRQLPLIQNMYYDASSGRLRTRYPFKRYSTAACTGGNSVNGITHFDNEFHVVSHNSGTHTVYYLDSNLAPQSIGNLNGTAYPSFQPFAGDLCIANGGAGVEITTGRVLTNIANVPADSLCLLEKDGQLALVGDSNYPDTYFESGWNNKDEWSGGTSQQYSCGYQFDDVELTGMSHGAYGLIVLFKKGRSRKEIWLLDPTEDNPVARLVSETEVPHTFRCAARAAGSLWIMDDVQGPMMLQGIDATEKIVIDPASLEIGQRILKTWSMSTHAWMCVYPPHSQIWMCPQPDVNNYIWILNYRTGSWVRFKPAGTLSFYCAYWHPDDGYLYLGGSDGFVYRYTTDDSTVYTDQTGASTYQNYTQIINSKIYDLFPYHNHMIKSPVLKYRAIATGSGKFSIRDDYGAAVVLDDTVSITNPRATLYDYRNTTLYEKRNETLFKRSVQSKKFDQHQKADNFQFRLTLNSGAIELHSIVAQVAKIQET